MVNSPPELYVDYDEKRKLKISVDFDQIIPISKFVLFLANISVYEHAHGLKFDLMGSFLLLNKRA